MRRAAFLLALALLAAVVGGWLLWGRPASRAPVLEGARVEAASGETARDGTEEDAPALARVDERGEIVSVPVSDDASAARDALARVVGRILLEDGGPAAGAAITMHGSRASAEREREHGLPERWEDPSASTGADGAFEIALDPPRAYQFTLEAAFPGHAVERWRWREIAPGSVIDLGEVVLRRAGSIAGRVVGADGAPLALAWRVRAEGAFGASDADRQRASVVTTADPATAEFRLDGLPPGPIALTASVDVATRITGPTVEVRGGEETRVELRYEGPDPRRRIVATPVCRAFSAFARDVRAIVLLRDGREIARGRPFDPAAAGVSFGESHQSVVFDDLDPGVYEIVLDDERFERWSKTGVRPGEPVLVELVGNASVAVDVADAASGAPISRYDLDFAFVFRGGWSFSPREFRLQSAGDPPPEDGVFSGLIPHDAELVVSAPGYVATRIALDVLLPNERRRVSARLARGSTVVARVVHESGIGAGGTRVELHPGDVAERELDDELYWRQRRKEHGEPRELTTDASGTATFDAVTDGRWSVLASLGGGARALAPVDVAGADTEIELRLPGVAFVSGIVHGATDALSGVRFVARPAEPASDQWLWNDAASATSAPLDAEGRFRVGPLVEGEWIACLVLPSFRVPAGRHGASMYPGSVIDLERLVLAGGDELEREYEIGARAPGRVRASITLDGGPAEGLILHLYSLTSDGELEQVPAAGAVTAAGAAELAPVLPGSWRLVVQDMELQWRWGYATPIEIEPERESVVSAALELVSGELLVRELGGGAPLADATVHWTCDAAGFPLRGDVRTGAGGELRATFPPGLYRFGTVWPEDGTSVLVDWSASGATPGVIELPRR